MKRDVQRTTVSQRSISASEIARDVNKFETWASFQGLHQVAFSDLPRQIRSDVDEIFHVNGKLPGGWVSKSSGMYKRLKKTTPSFVKLLRDAQKTIPELFSAEVEDGACEDLLIELGTVLPAHRQIQTMREEREKWSESDYAAKVYDIFRTSAAVKESSCRTKCKLSLPKQLPRLESRDPTVTRILKSRTVSPDCVIFVSPSSVNHLSSTKSSIYNCLNTHPNTTKSCGQYPGSSFRYQATPCMQLPQRRCFEFVSSIWEDKKLSTYDFESAYRQNRMACASAARHLHSLRIQAPVIGLLWADGKVRAHVDWCVREGGQLAVYSAPYPGSLSLSSSADEKDGSPKDTKRSTPEFFEWDLSRPEDIISVFLLIRNIDQWTAGRFRERIEKGVEALGQAITQGGCTFEPWRHEGLASPAQKGPTLRPTALGKENTISTSTELTTTSKSSAPSTSVSVVIRSPPRGTKKNVSERQARGLERVKRR